MPLFGKGRVLVELPPAYMDALPSGRLADARQPLRDDKELKSFFMNERVIAAAGESMPWNRGLNVRLSTASGHTQPIITQSW